MFYREKADLGLLNPLDWSYHFTMLVAMEPKEDAHG